MGSNNASPSVCSSSLEQENSAAAVAHALQPPQHLTVNISPLNLENGAAADHETHPHRPRFDIELFEAQVHSSKQSALQVAGLQILSRFFGFCALTWASVVLLGGFASALRLLDFYLISALLLLEAVRLFTVQIFYKLLSRAFFREDRRPQEFKFIDRQPIKALLLDLLGQGLSLILATASLISSIIRLFLSRSYPLSEKNPLQDDGLSNLPSSLYTFYALVIFNSIFAIASSLLRPFLRQRCHGYSIFSRFACFDFHGSNSAEEQNSLMCFHDEVYKTAMEAGLPEADRLDILGFAFTKLASDHQRNIRPSVIKELNRDMIRYLYHGQHGIGMVCEYLKSGDVWKQIAAANLPGFWAEEPSIGSQLALFWTLRERMCGAGKDAKSALTSIQWLALAWAADASSHVRDYPFLLNTTGNVVDTLVRLILEPTGPTLFFQVRAFEACCRHPKVLECFHREGDPMGNTDAICAGLQDLIVEIEAARGRGEDGSQIRPEWQSRLRVLCCKLHSTVASRGGRTWTPTRMYACNALLNLLSNGGKEPLGAGIKAALKTDVRHDPAMASANGSYFRVEDLKVFEKVRFKLDLEPYDKWETVHLRQANGNKLCDRQAIYAIVNEARRSL